MTIFVELYHPALPGTPHKYFPQQSESYYEALGWLPVDGSTPAPADLYLTPDVGDLRYLRQADVSTPGTTTGDTLRAAFGTVVVTVSASDSSNPGRADYTCTGTNDDQTVQSAVNSLPAGGGIVLLRRGTYHFGGAVTLPARVGIVGEGSPETTIVYGGAAGGRVLTTAAFTGPGMAAWTGGLRGFQITYPFASITAATKVVYLAQPFAAVDIAIVSDSTAESPVTGSVGLELDGCSNPGPFRVHAIVQAQLDAGVKVRANHVRLSAQGAYCNAAIDVDADSQASTAGPPYDVNIYGFHAFHPQVAAIRIHDAHGVHVWGGLNEAPGGAPDMRCESTFGGVASLRETETIASARLVHYGTGVVHVENTQYRERNRWTGSADGTPVDLAAWTDLTLQNGWTNPGGGFINAQYRKTIDGDIELQGYIAAGTLTAGTVLAQLNGANQRPAGTLVYEVRSMDGPGEVRVDVDGSVIFMSGPTTAGHWLSLSGIKWTPTH